MTLSDRVERAEAMTNPNNLSKIIAGLSRSQREAVLMISTHPERFTQVAGLNGLNTFRALVRKGILTHRIIAMVSCARLTPFGLQVRQALQDQGQ